MPLVGEWWLEAADERLALDDIPCRVTCASRRNDDPGRVPEGSPRASRRMLALILELPYPPPRALLSFARRHWLEAVTLRGTTMLEGFASGQIARMGILRSVTLMVFDQLVSSDRTPASGPALPEPGAPAPER
ncbi:MAG: hypothetical protein HUU35_16560 [Armatimonadetes bacterium]|nr:hypothetical protein [Armatimonadota bacterium]